MKRHDDAGMAALVLLTRHQSCEQRVLELTHVDEPQPDEDADAVW